MEVKLVTAGEAKRICLHNRWQFDKNGKLNGAYKLFFMSGLIAEENLYINNEIEGVRIDYTYDNGGQFICYTSPYTDENGN